MGSTNHYFKKALAKSSVGLRNPEFSKAHSRQLLAGFFMRATLHT